jgi:protoheme IX farnesyltransferase
MVGASNAYNQVIEKDLDALMDRTKNRPVASGRMNPNVALTIAIFLTLVGLVLLYFINPKTAMFGAISIFLYTSLYTPLKIKTPLSVFVGAFPGAIPFMLGWVAATGHFGIEAGTLFLIQFFWQFPHFWAIAWVAHKDYSAAGFKLLPSDKGPTKFTAVQTIMYSTLMLPIGVLPYYYNISGITSLWILMICNIAMIALSIRLYIKMDVASARRVMFSSYFYLAVVFIALLADKVIKI